MDLEFMILTWESDDCLVETEADCEYEKSRHHTYLFGVDADGKNVSRR